MLKLQAKGVAISADEHHWTVHCVRSSGWRTFHLHSCISHPMYLRLTIFFLKPPPHVISPILFVLLFLFHSGLHPWLCWLLERSQISRCPRQLQTCARLMQGWVASAGCPPPNKNPGYASDACIIYSCSCCSCNMFISDPPCHLIKI